MYADAGRWVNVQKLRRFIHHSKIDKETGKTVIEVDESVEESHLCNEDIIITVQSLIKIAETMINHPCFSLSSS